MGCTHFPLIENEYRKFFKDTVLIHSGEAIVEYLKDRYEFEDNIDTDIKYFATENPSHLKEVAKKWL
jgi:glutamate racemase